jgi:CBS-domain-containing membrane protein
VFAHPDETLRTVAERMATSGLFAMPVVESGTRKLLGLVTAEELLKGREWAHFRENKHERLRMPFRRQPAPETVGETV